MFDLKKLLNIINNSASTELDLTNEKVIDFSSAQQSSFSFPDERQQGVHLQLVQLSETHLLTTHPQYARVCNLANNESFIIKSPSSKHGIVNVRRLVNNRILFNQLDSADIYIYDWKEQKLICKISPGGACAVLENNNLVMVKGDKTGKIAIEIWDSERGTLLNTFYEKLAKLKYPISIYPVFSLSDDKIAFIIKEINTLFVWDVKNGRQINSINNIYTAPSPIGLVCPITKLSSGKHVVTSCKQDALDIWDIESGSHIQTFKNLAGLSTYLVCNNGQLVTVYKTGDMQVWDLQTGKDIQLLKNAGGVLFQISDNLIVTVPRDGNVKIWDTQNWQCLKVLGGYYKTPSISCVEISDNKLAVLYYDQLRIWEFGYRYLQFQDVIELLKALKSNQTIITLNLSGIILGDQGAIEIADLITHNQTIITIDLQNTHITDEGAKTLLNAIQRNHTLKELKLNGNSISVNLLEQLHQRFAKQNIPSPVQNITVDRDTPNVRSTVIAQDQLQQDQSSETHLPSGATVKNSSAEEKIKVFNVGNSPNIAHVSNTQARNINVLSASSNSPKRTATPPTSPATQPSSSVSHTNVDGDLSVSTQVENNQPIATASGNTVSGDLTMKVIGKYEKHIHQTPSPEEKRIVSQQKLEDDLRKLQDRQLKNEEIQQELAVYVPIQGSNNFEDNDLFDVATKVKAFLASRKKVLLLLGDSGMGKSLFGRALERELWEGYENSKPIPLFISLPGLRDPIKNAIEEYLSQQHFKPQQIAQLKKEYSFIFILDGYDEIAGHNPGNLYVSNKLSDWKEPKVIITCRSQYLLTKKQSYRSRFSPDRQGELESSLFQEITVKPFIQAQIESYLKNFVKMTKPVWEDWQIYRKHIDAIPGLKDLIETPFILKITVEVLPYLIDEDQEEKYPELTHLKLYDAFMQRWFERQEDKLRRQGHPIEEDWDIQKDFRDFSEKLAKKMLEQKINEIVIETKVKQFFGQATQTQSSTSQWDEFFSNDPKLQLIRSGCPLKKLGDNRFAFIHESLLEYFGDREKFVKNMAQASVSPFEELEAEGFVKDEIFTESLPPKQSQLSIDSDCIFESSKLQLNKIIQLDKLGSFEKQVGKPKELSGNNNIKRNNSVQQLEALLNAIRNNDLDNMRALLKHIDVNTRHPQTQIIALHQAAIHSHNDVIKEVLEILFAAGADPNLRVAGETASECAKSNDRPDVAELIEQTELNRIKKKDQTLLNKPVKLLNRKGLANLSSNQLITLLKLSDETSVGTAVDDGGCGFDALAQCLGGNHTEKSLRLACHKYYLNLLGEDNKKAVDGWIRKLGANNPNVGNASYLLVQYTGEELKDPTFSIKGNPSWFTQEIDGRILCHAMSEVLPNGIHVIEITLHPESVGHYVITKEGYSQIEDEDKIKTLYALPTLVVSNRHFVPLLPKEKVPVMQNYPLEIQKNHKLFQLPKDKGESETPEFFSQTEHSLKEEELIESEHPKLYPSEEMHHEKKQHFNFLAKILRY